MAFLNIPIKDNSTPLTPTEWNYLVDRLNNRKLRDLIDVQSADAQDKDMIRHNGSGWVFYDITDDHYTKAEINALFGVQEIGSIPQLTVDWGNIQGTIRNQLDLVANFGDLKAASNTWDGEHYAKNYILDGASASQSTDGYMDYFYVSDGDNSAEISDKTTLKITGDGVTFDYVNREFKINTQNTIFDIHNATGETLLKGTIVYPNGTSTAGISNVSKAIADSHETLEAQLGVIYEDVLDGSDGKVMIQGVLKDVDTSGLSEGLLYLSSSTAGELTNTKSTFPNYTVLLGVVDKVDALYGEITIDTQFNLQNDLTNFWNGTVRESFKCDVLSDGVNVSLDIYPANGHPNLTMLFSDGWHTLVATPKVNVPLVAGTDSVPQENYVYILQSDKVVSVSTSGYPTGVEHIKLGMFFIRSAAKTVLDGALHAHIWNDHIVDAFDFQGHLSHITERLRQEGAKYSNGIDIIPTAALNSSIISLSGGVVYQLHKQVWQPYDMATGDHIHITNHPTTPYVDVTDLDGACDNDSTGTSLTNSSFSIVFWGAMNSSPEASNVFANLPRGSYSKQSPDLAVSDAFNYSDYTIPSAFRGTGFLIARVTYVREANGDWSVYDIQDLRTGSGGAGGGGGGTGGVTTFAGLTDTPNLYTGYAGWFPRVAVGEDGLEYVDINKSFIDALGINATHLGGELPAFYYPASNPNGYTGDQDLTGYLNTSNFIAGTDYQTPLVAGTDYQTPLVAGTDYLAPNGDGSQLTGIVTTDTWHANTQAQEGYVAAGGTNYNKVWATDETGTPAWRTPSTGNQVGQTQKKAFTNQTVIPFAHNLGERYPTVQVYDENGFMMIAYSIKAVDDNNCTVTFDDGAKSGTIAATVGGAIGTLPNNVAYSNADNAFSVAQTGVSFNGFTGFGGDGVATTGSRSDHTHSGYATDIHSHVIGDITDLTSILSTKLESSDLNPNWDTAFGWGDHSVEGYLKAVDKYTSWNLKTNSIQRTTIQDGGDLDIIQGANITITYGAGGKVTIAGTEGGVTEHSALTLDDGTNPHGTTKSDVGLANVDNTADTDKPVSTAQQTALDLKANKTDVLEKTNTDIYNPTGDYHPATKKYVDDNAGGGGGGGGDIDGGVASSIYTAAQVTDGGGAAG